MRRDAAPVAGTQAIPRHICALVEMTQDGEVGGEPPEPSWREDWGQATERVATSKQDPFQTPSFRGRREARRGPRGQDGHLTRAFGAHGGTTGSVGSSALRREPPSPLSRLLQWARGEAQTLGGLPPLGSVAWVSEPHPEAAGAWPPGPDPSSTPPTPTRWPRKALMHSP